MNFAGIAGLFAELVVVERRTGEVVDQFGREIPTYGVGQPVWAAVEPKTSAEDLNDADSLMAGWLVFLPPGTPVGGRDRLVIRGCRGRIVGPPRESVGSHIEVDVIVEDA